MSNEITHSIAEKHAREILNQLTPERWSALLSKDVPPEITTYVVEQVSSGRPLDAVRRSLGILSVTDSRWRKIMTAIRAAKRIDATGLFVKWLERNERLGDKINKEVEAVMNNEKPFSKMLFQAISTLSQLQVNTVKLGKELGVFAEAQEKGGGGQGVTIVVSTNVPSPDEKTIIVHQNEQLKKNQALLDQFKKPGVE